MSVYSANLQAWWHTLSSAWQKVIIQALDLEQGFGLNDLEYIFTIEELHCVGLADLSPLYYLPQLQCLHLSHCQVADYSPLRALPNLRELHLTYGNNPDVGLLVGLQKLEVLDISYPSGELLHQEDLIHLKQLKEVYLNACRMETLRPLLALDQLEIACMYFNPIRAHEVQNFQNIRRDCRLMW
ncbi:MAG: leucine-rich repeat domain-containing protein [Bacteroidota bacterium]